MLFVQLVLLKQYHALLSSYTLLISILRAVVWTRHLPHYVMLFYVISLGISSLP